MTLRSPRASSFPRPVGLAVKSLLAAAFLVPAITPPLVMAASPSVTVTEARLQVLIPSRPAAGYFTLRNDGAQPLSLTGAQAADCESLMLHRSMEQGGMARMEMVDAVSIPAHGTLRFQPGGYHLMCMNPSGALLTGHGTETVTLTFAGGGETKVPFAIGKAGR
jgi:periplasmic copper chaperone A